MGLFYATVIYRALQQSADHDGQLCCHAIVNFNKRQSIKSQDRWWWRNCLGV